jgi:hypothetical protein
VYEACPPGELDLRIPELDRQRAEERERKADRARLRAQFARRRLWGLKRRHAAKLRHWAEHPPEGGDAE